MRATLLITCLSLTAACSGTPECMGPGCTLPVGGGSGGSGGGGGAGGGSGGGGPKTCTVSDWPAAPAEWSLPDYGVFNGSTFTGRGRFLELNDRFSDGLNFEVMDLTGDGVADLVVTSVDADVTVGASVAGLGQTKWLVFPGGPTGFTGASPVEWALPDYGVFGGSTFTGRGRFHELADRFSDGLNFSVLDVNGDRAPDLVVTDRDADVTVGPNSAGLGRTEWLVFVNTKSGFAATPTTFTLPDYGVFNGSTFTGRGRFLELFDRFSDGLNFTVRDLTGDGRVDLVITDRDADVTVGASVAGLGQTKWLVFAGGPTGFTGGSPLEWALPDYGVFNGSTFTGRGRFFELFDRFSDGLNFSVLDVNGDRRPDLVVTDVDADVTVGASVTGLGQTKWLVFEGGATGFTAGSPKEWSLPDYGVFTGSTFTGRGRFLELFDRFSDGLNFSVLDLTGDGRVDLVITDVGSDVATGASVTGLSRTRWLVFEGGAAGFTGGSPREWSLPDYGVFSGSTFPGRGRFLELTDRFSDGLNFSVVDLSGDGAPDLVVTDRGSDVTQGPDVGGLARTKWLVFSGPCR